MNQENHKVHIVGFTGSLRAKSLNQAILKTARELLPEDAELEIVSLGDLPLYNMDQENDLPTTVKDFKETIRRADALLIATPEFNGSIPGVLKNALDWASRPYGQSVLTGKPTAITGVGGRGGTRRAQEHLRFILNCLRVPLLETVVLITDGATRFDDNGTLHDESVREQVRLLLDELVGTARQQNQVLAS